MRLIPFCGMVALLGTAQAQLDETQVACAPLSYVLKVLPDTRAKMQVAVSINGQASLTIDSAKNSQMVKADVTSRIRPTGNTLNVQWKVKGDANDPNMRQSWVTLQMGSGNAFTPVAVFRTDYYPGRQSLMFKFGAPPKNSLRCDKASRSSYNVALGQAVGDGRVSQWTLSVNGEFYAITVNEPSDMMHGLRLDLRPYLVHGQNDVKLLWKVLRDKSGSSGSGAQITWTVDGKTDVLAKTVVNGKLGDTGQLQTSISVP